MFWKLAIRKNRKALVHIVAGLWKLVNAPSLEGENETDKPEARYLGPITARRLATALRKVEAALRRLIVLYMNTQDLKQGPGIKRPVPRPDFSCFSGNVAACRDVQVLLAV